MPKVYITGASGKLGRAVLAKVPGAVPLVRRPSGLPGEVVTDFSVDQLRGIFRNAGAVLHLAGSVDTLDRAGMQEANVGLTWRVVDSLPKKAKIVFASSISVYGKRPAAIPADEKTKPRPDSAYARSKFEAENIVAKHTNHAILRIGTLYGPQFEDYFRVLSMMERGKMRIIGNGSNRVPFVHVEDAADACISALGRGQGIYVVAGDPETQRRVYEAAAAALKIAPPSASIGMAAALVIASFGELAYPLTGKRPALTREHVSVLGCDRAFNCARAKAELGFSPRPISEGIGEMAAAYRGRGAAQAAK